MSDHQRCLRVCRKVEGDNVIVTRICDGTQSVVILEKKNSHNGSRSVMQPTPCDEHCPNWSGSEHLRDDAAHALANAAETSPDEE